MRDEATMALKPVAVDVRGSSTRRAFISFAWVVAAGAMSTARVTVGPEVEKLNEVP